MRKIALVVVATLASSALADAPKKTGFWSVLVTPNAKWVLVDKFAQERKENAGKLVVETYDVRKVGAADVARLRWTYVAVDGTKSEHGCAGCYTQIAVTSAGLYIVNDAKDDGQIAASLKAKPSRSEPPKPYKGTKQNDGRYLTVAKDQVCFGEGPLPDAGPCEEGTCYGELCVDRSKGVVSVEGNWSPNESLFAQDGFAK